jgi:hypothetical protein
MPASTCAITSAQFTAARSVALRATYASKRAMYGVREPRQILVRVCKTWNPADGGKGERGRVGDGDGLLEHLDRRGHHFRVRHVRRHGERIDVRVLIDDHGLVPHEGEIPVRHALHELREGSRSRVVNAIRADLHAAIERLRPSFASEMTP